MPSRARSATVTPEMCLPSGAPHQNDQFGSWEEASSVGEMKRRISFLRRASYHDKIPMKVPPDWI
jgi:hypothetical protein